MCVCCIHCTRVSCARFCPLFCPPVCICNSDTRSIKQSFCSTLNARKEKREKVVGRVLSVCGGFGPHGALLSLSGVHKQDNDHNSCKYSNGSGVPQSRLAIHGVPYVPAS